MNISRPTVSKLVAELLEEQTLIEVGQGPSNGGKRPTYLQINSEACDVIGIHVAYPTIRIALANNTRDFLQRTSFPAPDTLDLLIMRICEHTDRLLQATGLARADLSAVGIAFSGIVNPHLGKIVYARFFPDVSGAAFRERLEKFLKSCI